MYALNDDGKYKLSGFPLNPMPSGLPLNVYENYAGQESGTVNIYRGLPYNLSER